MSGCEQLSAGRLEALAAGRLSPAERAALAAHLSEGACEDCLARLAELPEDQTLLLLGGPAAELTPAEADRVFAAATRAPGRVIPWPRLVRVVLPLAAALAAVVLFPRLAGHQPDGPEIGLKGPVAGVVLEGVIGHVIDGRPVVGAHVQDRVRLAHDDQLLFRYRLAQPGYLYLFGPSGRGSRFTIWWQSDDRLAAGEGEISAAGQALAVQASSLGLSAEIFLVFAPDQRSWPGEPFADPTPDPSALVRDCPSCGLSRLHVDVSAGAP